MAWQYGNSRVRDREAIIEWATGVTGDASVLFLDTETTGIGRTAEIVDIAVISSAGQVALESLVKPKNPIPPEATLIHGICDGDVASAPGWEEVYPALLDLISGRRLVVYNVDFDRRVIGSVCQACNLREPEATWDCAMAAYAAFMGQPSKHRRRGYRRYKLEEAVRAFGIAPGGHRAAADAEATRLLVHALARVPR